MAVAGKYVVLHQFHHYVVPKTCKVKQENIAMFPKVFPGPHRLV